MSALIQVPYIFFNCKFVISFEIDKYKSSIIVLKKKKNSLDYLEPFTIPYVLGLC